ncbi:MAG: hypothetical protein MUC89_24035 [Acetobacteraceae bacterium]|jgi:hypothetical protein|nr:hypothetical protein [Acetobacteraceae bacterium]
MGMATDRIATQQQARRPRPGPADPQAVVRGPDLTVEQTAALRARQKSRNRLMLAVLLGLVVLFFALTISRMSQVSDPQALSRPGALGPAGGIPLTTAPSR